MISNASKNASDSDNALQKSDLLTTKLFVPQVGSEIVSRQRLILKLNAYKKHKLILISAPAGFGKSTLISDWIRQSDMPVAWFSIDKNDNDPIQFLNYVVAAIQSVDKNIGKNALSMLQSPQPPFTETVVTSLLNDITNRSIDFVLIFEDYHLIENKQIHSTVAYLLDFLPSQMHLVIATRSDPLLPLARLRIQNQIIEIRANDLCFTTEEIPQFFEKVIDLRLSNQDVELLESRTEGWVAGLQMAALSMQGRENISSFIRSFAGDDRYIVDYLMEEVLNRQPEQIRNFLLQTSILDRFCGSLCEAVTGEENSLEVLYKIEKGNLFIVPLDNKRHWYRYHHLFADLLRVYLMQSMPELEPVLHSRASKWYEQNGLISEAITHSFAAKDFEQAAKLTEQSCFDRMSHGEDFSTMLSRLQELPDEIVRNSPRLNIMYAWMLSITLQLDDVEPRLQEIEKNFNTQLPADLRLQIANIRAELARHQKKLAKSIELSQQILEALPENLSATDQQTYTGTIFNLAWTLYDIGDVFNAQQKFSEAFAIGEAAGSITLKLLALKGLGQSQMWQGQLHQAAETFQQGLQLADKEAQPKGQPVLVAAYIHVALGELLREWNRLDEAMSHLEKGIALGRQCQIDAETLREGYLSQARIKNVLGDRIGVQNTIQEAGNLSHTCPALEDFDAPIEACKIQLMLIQTMSTSSDINTDILNTAQQWIEERELKLDGPIDSLNKELEYLVWARLLIFQNNINQALQLLDYMLSKAEESKRVGRAIEILILQSLALQIHSDTDNALVCLGKALSLAEPGGYVRIFADEGTPMLELLQDICDFKTSGFGEATVSASQSYIKKLILALEYSDRFQIKDTMVDALSERELEVLQLIEIGLSNQKIANKLFVSLNTVKTHIKNINSKLNVHSRAQAIAQAKKLGLL